MYRFAILKDNKAFLVTNETLLLKKEYENTIYSPTKHNSIVSRYKYQAYPSSNVLRLIQKGAKGMKDEAYNSLCCLASFDLALDILKENKITSSKEKLQLIEKEMNSSL